MILALLGPAPSDGGVIAVGAGPLEHLINEHGDEVVDEVEQAARQSPEFARALRAVAVDQGSIRASTADRLARWLPAP
jgi:hypothetical protein